MFIIELLYLMVYGYTKTYIIFDIHNRNTNTGPICIRS